MSKKKVLIPLDGSEISQHILSVVQQFLAPNEVQLTLLRVMQPFIDPMSELYMASPAVAVSDAQRWPAQDARTEWETHLQAIQDELEAEAMRLRAVGYEVGVAVRAGNPVEEIMRYVNENQISLIAMATHGRKGLSRLLMGSVTEEVLRCATVPVLLERPTSSNGHDQPVPPELYPSDNGQ